LQIAQGFASYVSKVRRFQPNARLYLLSITLYGLSIGVYRLLFNFYVLSLGYGEGFLGTLITVSSLVALLGALPAGFVSDWLGRKPAFLLSGGFSVLAVAGIVVWHAPAGLVSMSVLAGLSQCLFGVTGAPFLMENSGEEERSYLFSFSSGLETVAGFLGNWVGGRLPTWLGSMGGVSPISTRAYGWSLLAVVALDLMAMIPLVLVGRSRSSGEAPPIFAPFRYARKKPGLLARLVGPTLIGALGAGLLMPFMNVFYRNVYHQPDATIGTLFAFGSLAMGLGLLVAPPIADRYGKIWLVVVSQAVSIPFLFLMGFAPWFWLSVVAYLVRLVLMNMSSPIYQAFVMERVESEARATVSSLSNMCWSFGWAFSPQLSGWLQENYGFGPVYFGTGTAYTIATFLTYCFFARRKVPNDSAALTL
jgi:MFS family permease